jgi:protein arginine kinase activator
MKCEFCDELAKVHLTQMLKNGSLEIHLCERCAEERGITDPSSFLLQNLLGSEGSKVEQSVPMLKDTANCEHCGFSFQDFKRAGRLGCSKCYQVFSGDISAMLSTMHRGQKHKGKRPRGLVDNSARIEAVSEAKEKLQKAIDEENFEIAAKIRDEILVLEQATEN